MNDSRIPPLYYCPQCEKKYEKEIKYCPDDGTKLIKADSLLGKIFNNRYQITQKIGQGGMGAVYKAKQLSTCKMVAIKVILQGLGEDTTTIERFKREVKVQSLMQHPNIVSLFDFAQSEEGLYYFVMDFVEGKSLKQLLKEQGSLPLPLFLELAIQICDGLEYAHAQSIVHRDLKTENIIIQAYSSQKIIRILDFGLAKELNLHDSDTLGLSTTGLAIGTPNYISPEQAKGELDKIGPQSDLYSLGVIFYQMLTNQLPFNAGTPWGIIHQHIHEQPTPIRKHNPFIPKELEHIILHCLEKNYTFRYSSAHQIKQALLKFAKKRNIPCTEDHKHDEDPTGIFKASFFNAPTKPIFIVTRKGLLLLILLVLSVIYVYLYSEKIVYLWYQKQTPIPLPGTIKYPSPSPEIGKHLYRFPLPFTETGKVLITTIPTKADIFLNNHFLGKTPQTLGPFLPGELIFHLKLKNFITEEISVIIKPNTTIRFPEIRLSPKTGNILFKIKLNSTSFPLPKKGEIKIGQMEWKSVDLPWLECNLPCQNYNVDLRIPGYKIKSKPAQAIPVSFEKDLTALFELEPYPDFYYIQGREHFGMKRYNKAVRLFEKALRVDPVHQESGFWLGQCGEKLKETKIILKGYKIYLSQNPKDLKTKTKFDKYKQRYKKFLYYYTQGQSLFTQQKFQQALSFFTKAMQRDPENKETLLWRGGTLARLEKYEDAILDFTKIIRISPSQEAYFERGICYKNLKKYEQALTDLCKAISLNKAFADGYFERAEIYLTLKDTEHALSDFQKAYEHDPQRFLLPGLQKIKEIYQQTGKPERAVETEKLFNQYLPDYYKSYLSTIPSKEPKD